MTSKVARHSRLDTYSVTLDDGRTVHLFVNLDSNLVVLDVIDADEEAGFEILRRKV